MLNTVTEEIKNIWMSGRSTKHSESGWLSANAVCCTHNGESADTRKRGGLIINDDVVNYHCFNCGFKANYTPGRHLNLKMRKLLGWMGADDNTIKRLTIEAIRVRDLMGVSHDLKFESHAEKEITFKKRDLPENSKSFKEWETYIRLGGSDLPDNLLMSAQYIEGRGGGLLSRYDFYVTDQTAYNMHKRVIVPVTWKNEVIGYTSRAWDGAVKPKYHSSYEPNVVFNIDKQKPDSKIVIVVEGPFDAMAVDGVAILGSECSETQADIIESLGKEIIVVPDADKAGMKLVDNALEYGWAVSFPPWFDKYKDVSSAVAAYGRLFVLKTIIDSALTTKLRIELAKKKYK